MSEKHPQDPSYDPKYRQIVVRLEALPPGKSFAVTSTDKGFLLWYYDTTNRIMSPGIATYDTAAELVADLAASLVANRADAPEIATTLSKARDYAELARLEFLAKAYREGGYPSGTGERLLKDEAEAKWYEKLAQAMREKLRGA